jgi:uncharacterized phage protein (TIGR02220 family)
MKNKVYSFSTEDAVKYGIDSAIILHNMRYWLDYARAHGEMENDGFFWMFASATKMKELFPFWSANKIQKLLKKLEDDGVIISGHYNKSKFDRTKWYTMKEFSIQPNGGMRNSETADCTFSETAESLYNQYEINSNNKSNLMSDKSDAIAVLEHLNAVCGTKYKSSTKSHIQNINARIADGYTVSDCKAVIDLKNKEWGSDQRMSTYLRPQTLFSASKFPGYAKAAKTSPAQGVNKIGDNFDAPEGMEWE